MDRSALSFHLRPGLHVRECSCSEPLGASSVALICTHAHQAIRTRRCARCPAAFLIGVIWRASLGGTELRQEEIVSSQANETMRCVVLVVDDDPLVVEVLCAMLEDLGCEAVCVASPIKGLEKIASDQRIAMLITDIQMPVMDGFELADRVHAGRPDLPVVLMSGEAPGRPGYPVIRKPLSQRQLAEIIASIAEP
jgi:CheY-like chemotaxis protein